MYWQGQLFTSELFASATGFPPSSFPSHISIMNERATKPQRETRFNSFVTPLIPRNRLSTDKTLLQVQVFSLQTLKTTSDPGLWTTEMNEWCPNSTCCMCCIISFHFTCSLARQVKTKTKSLSVSFLYEVTLPPDAECRMYARRRPSVRPPSHAVECQDKLLRPIFRHSAAGATDSLGTRGWHVPAKTQFYLAAKPNLLP